MIPRTSRNRPRLQSPCANCSHTEWDHYMHHGDSRTACDSGGCRCYEFLRVTRIADAIKTVQRITDNGVPCTCKIYERPGFSASIAVGDIESFWMLSDEQMTFYPREIREIAAALVRLADMMESQ